MRCVGHAGIDRLDNARKLDRDRLDDVESRPGREGGCARASNSPARENWAPRGAVGSPNRLANARERPVSQRTRAVPGGSWGAISPAVRCRRPRTLILSESAPSVHRRGVRSSQRCVSAGECRRTGRRVRGCADLNPAAVKPWGHDRRTVAIFDRDRRPPAMRRGLRLASRPKAGATRRRLASELS